MMMRTTAYQWLTRNHLILCRLSSEKKRFRRVANGPDGSTSLHFLKTSQYPLYWLHGVPALENMSGTSKGAWLSSKDDTQGWLSPLSLQHSSQALVSLSSGPWLHWHD